MMQQGRKTTVKTKDVHQALDGIKILEVAQWAAVPGAGAILAEFGADVIHVEHPGRGDGARAAIPVRAAAPFNYGWEQDNHNKRSIGIDVRTENGRQLIYELVKKSDVFLCNFRQYELERYGLEYKQLKKLNPGIICAILTAYGRKGPDRALPGFDYGAFWTRAGLMATLPEPGGPVVYQRPALGDRTASLALAGAISLALFVRERTGIGQEVDLSLFSTGIYVNGRDIQASLLTNIDCKHFPRKAQPNPLFNYYRCKDGRYIIVTLQINIQPDPHWPGFCKAIGREDLEHDKSFDTLEKRLKNNVELISVIDEAFAAKTSRVMVKRLQENGVIFALAQTTTEVAADKQARPNKDIVKFDHPKFGPIEMTTNPWKLSKTPASIREPAPDLGQHTDEIMTELGYKRADIAKLREQKIIR